MAKRLEVVAQLQEIASRSGVTVPWDRITVNRWRPDTCGCELEQWFDDAEPNPKTVLYARTLASCPAHPIAGQPQWATVRDENLRKNAALAMVRNLIDEATAEETAWVFTNDRMPGSDARVLQIVIPGANNAARSSVQAAADAQYGAGAVEVG